MQSRSPFYSRHAKHGMYYAFALRALELVVGQAIKRFDIRAHLATQPNRTDTARLLGVRFGGEAAMALSRAN
jgi:hypothetical protein